LGLAAGLQPSRLVDLYLEHARTVFTDSLYDDIVDMGKLVGADYSLEFLYAILDDLFGDLTLAELPKKVLIATFDLDNGHPQPAERSWKPKFFHNFPGDDSDGDQKVADVAVRTSAAPTYFPIFQGYIDGGVVANNPAMCAVAQALHPPTGGQTLEQVVVLSFGTGRNPQFLKVEDPDWGLVQWARHLVPLMLDGAAGTVDYQCNQLFGPRYRRVNPSLPEAIPLDAVDQIDLLLRVAQGADLSETVNWLEQYF
jgi:patatin-like phospholipase/acyl hydrolase